MSDEKRLRAGVSVQGTVRVAPQVLATIVNTATLALPGVAAMGHVPGHRFPFGAPEQTRGVRVQVRDNTVSVDLYVVTVQGVNMVATGTAIREAVTSAIETTLGMSVASVSIYIQNTAK